MTERFTKEQLVVWADRLIEETHSDIAISRTDAHAESYYAQLALIDIALGALRKPTHEATDWQVEQAVADMEGENDMVQVPRGLLGAASGAITHPHHEAGVTLGLLRHYSFRKQPAPVMVSQCEQCGTACNNPNHPQIAVPSGSAANDARQNRDLVMMVKVLCHALKMYCPESKKAVAYMDYLKREGLISTTDCLRDGAKDGD